MMGAISRKLRGQHGASLLLALLFLLICSMVTASILMAAVANAGKHSSNLKEHQIYLTLSSAVSTLCDELNRCEYRGQYYSWKEPVFNEDGEEIGETSHFKQANGAYTYADTVTAADLSSVLRNDFDYIFGKEAGRYLSETSINGGTISGDPTPHTLTLTPSTGISDLNKQVHISMEVKDSYAIYITAYLDGLDTYKVEAELTPNASAPTLPTPLPYRGKPDEDQPNLYLTQTAPMKWKLGWITIWDEEKGDGSAS